MQRALTIRAAITCFSACLALAPAPGARAATLDFTGTLTVLFGPLPAPLPAAVVPGAGAAQVVSGEGAHLLSVSLAGGGFGPFTTTLDVTNYADLNSVVFSGIENLTGSFGGISGGPPGGGVMGLSGIAKICLYFAPCEYAGVSVPLTPTGGGAGFGIGGTHSTSGPVDYTYQHAPWTIGQPVMTIHTANSNVTSPLLPAGFAHGPASLTSSTAQLSGVLQLVTVSKVFTSLTAAFPEFPFTGILTLHFVPEPATLLLLASGVAALALFGRRGHRR